MHPSKDATVKSCSRAIGRYQEIVKSAAKHYKGIVGSAKKGFRRNVPLTNAIVPSNEVRQNPGDLCYDF
jgi:hypothetical protein